MRNSSLLLVILLCLTSCKNRFFYTDLYTRTDRQARYFQEVYSKQTEFNLSSIGICHFTELRGNALAMSSSNIFFHRDSLESNLEQAYFELLPLSVKPLKKSYFFDRNCNFLGRILPESKKVLSPQSESKYRNVILPQLSITSNSGKHIEGGGGMMPAEDMGEDMHLLEYKLTTAIYQNDTLIYMDNRTHWTEVFSERGELLNYQVPQVVIDSLVTLTLQEYFKRVK